MALPTSKTINTLTNPIDLHTQPRPASAICARASSEARVSRMSVLVAMRQWREERAEALRLAKEKEELWKRNLPKVKKVLKSGFARRFLKLWKRHRRIQRRERRIQQRELRRQTVRLLRLIRS